ncbi:hypothetical protein [Arundinibacter roseus]|uniref:Uncharacterized protein n=1 Tax=Arundinibacter roseus TaxID=2070510 RepID=A0A4V6P8M0_9BACT|nr:hypothetical protein [Arundinibacter roseus]TDB64005.1 hypothetical protein EZE20_13755 [Arundinibacter roseus]
MAKRLPKNQLPLDFSVRGDRMILALGQVESQRAAHGIFEELLAGNWLIEPAGEMADVSSAQDIIRQLGAKLPFPEVVKVAQLHSAPADFLGFAALFRQKGWVFVNALADANERYYHTYLLTSALGLYPSYPAPESMAQRAEQLVFQSLLPVQDVRSFFHEGITRLPGYLAADIADFFKVPFAIVLKRALQTNIITDEQFRHFMTVRPVHTHKPSELFLAPEGGIDDLEAQLFGAADE